MTNAFQPCDTLLFGGLIVDGLGAPAYAGSVAIRGERIVGVGDCSAFGATTRVDVSGLHICPGFIDTHAHDDALLLEAPTMLPKISQGVTTVVIGNCGVSIAPLIRDSVPPPLSEMGDVFRFGTFAEFVEALRNSSPATNVACLVGHTTLRVGAMQSLDQRATTAEIDVMRAACSEALRAGAIGLSSGVFYPPARAADWSEVASVAEVVGAARGIYATHLRDEGDHIIDAIDEAVRVAGHARVPLVLSHHKVMGCENFGRSGESLAHVARAAKHQPIFLDAYPYTAGASMLSEPLRARATRTIVTRSASHPEAAGRDLADIARSMGLSESDALQELAPGGAIYFLMDEGDMRRILSSPNTMIGSDGIAAQHPHPRLWGTFPRVLGRYARDLQLFSFEEAVRRMTSLPATQFGFAERGVLATGSFADIVAVDAANVADLATYEHPEQPSAGIRSVYVAGREVWNGASATGVRPGRLLSRAGITM